MNAIEMVTQILEMDKELENSKNEIRLLQQKNNRSCGCSSEEISEIEEYAILVGKKKMFDNIFQWGEPPVFCKMNGSDVEYTPYKEFVRKYVSNNKSNIPPMFSVNEIIEFLCDELDEKYVEKCNVAYEILLKQMKEESEAEE
ncbi:MAG: hypothetical protein ACLUVC_02345 [Longibaculum sp.]